MKGPAATLLDENRRNGTPGPWYIWSWRRTTRGSMPNLDKLVGRVLWVVQQGTREDSRLQTVAYAAFKKDAELMALAPELRDALKHVVDGDMCDHPNHEQWLYDLLRKAEGKRPKEMPI